MAKKATPTTKRYQIHRVTPESMENVLNRHAENDWLMHFVRAIGNHEKAHVLITFVREFPSHEEANAYMAARAERRAKHTA